MDLTHFHLMMNHVPVMAVVFGFFVLLAGVIWRSKAAAAVGLVMLTIAAVVAVPVYFTGESAEELIEGLPGVSDSVTKQHEASASLSMALVIAAGALAAATLLFSRRLVGKVPNYLMIATVFVSMLTGVSMIRTANLGGQVRHTELRSAAQVDPAQPAGREDRRSRDDDDH